MHLRKLPSGTWRVFVHHGGRKAAGTRLSTVNRRHDPEQGLSHQNRGYRIKTGVIACEWLTLNHDCAYSRRHDRGNGGQAHTG